MTPAKFGNFSCLWVALTLACQPNEPGETASEASSGATGETGDDTVTGDTGDDPTPILERATVLERDCSLTKPLTAVANAEWHTEALAVLDGAVWQVRAGSDALWLSTLAADGTLGASVELDGDMYAYREGHLAAGEGELAAVWIHASPEGEVSVRFAAVAGDGTVKVAAHAVSGVGGEFVQSPQLLARAGGWTLFYGTADAGGTGSIHRLLLDAAGEPMGASTEVVKGGQNYGRFAPSVVATADGHALTYEDYTGEGVEVFFVGLDGAGAQRAAPRRLSHTAGDGWYSFAGHRGQGLLAVGDGFWATWAESVQNDDFMDLQGNTTVHLAVLDAAGEGPSALLAAPVDGKSAAWPALFAFGEQVGLTWTAGTKIFICGGCIADDDVKLVLLDPSRVAPASAVVSHPHGSNGMVRPQVGVLGPQIVLTADIDFHALTNPAAGSTTCTPKT